jgi:serine/threonine protein kinase
MMKRRSSISKLSARMGIDKQLFINEGKGKIEKNYEILEIIGKGGYGVVKKVRHKISGSIRAMKVMQKDAFDPLSLLTISNEVEILKQLVIFLLV